MAPFTQWPDVVKAIVQTGTIETEYRRVGRGPATLLLTRVAAPARDDLLRRLSEDRLVIQPVELAAVGLWEEWLRGVVDGLGLDRPDLVVDADLADLARGFARRDPGRAGDVLIIDSIDP